MHFFGVFMQVHFEARRYGLRGLTPEEMPRLRESLQVTCFIAVMGNRGPTVLRIEEPSLPVTVNMRAGSVLPWLWSASGQAFLAFSDDADIRVQAQAEFDAGNEAQRSMLAGPDPVARVCRQVKDQGCAIVNDTLLRGISAVSAPVFDARGHVVAVLTALTCALVAGAVVWFWSQRLSGAPQAAARPPSMRNGW